MLQHCSYLCNMATDAEHQRCGIAFEMLQAAEDLALIAGEPEIFLHLRYSCIAHGVRSQLSSKQMLRCYVRQSKAILPCRLKDEVPAQLYKKGGFQSVKQDPFWIRLLGQERRLLLRLQARPKPPDT